MSDSLAPEFVDSNVLVYAHDRSAGRKRVIARALVDRLWEERTGSLSLQVLQEFAVNVTAKIPQPLSVAEAAGIVSALSEWRLHVPEPPDVVAALELQRRHQLSFWDAMILRSAARLGCRLLWSEDLNSGQVYDGVELRNPFAG